MNKETILELQKAFEELLTKAEAKSYIESECDCPAECCDGLEKSDASDEVGITPIDDCITTFLNKCTAESRVPTLEEAQSIYILDQINSKYN